jgi:hypothetical protein
MITKFFVTRAFAFLTTAATVFNAATPVEAYQAVQRFNQPEQRAPNGQLAVEAAIITVVACNGQGENGGQRYIYQYTNRAGFRAINPPNWGQSLGGHDWGTFQQAISAGCSTQVSMPVPTGNISGQWRLATSCHGWDGLQNGQNWGAIMNVSEAGDGSLQVSTSSDPLNVESQGGKLAGNGFSLNLHPRGWASILQFTGTASGAAVSGRIHHYTNDDCDFRMTR